MFLELGKGHLLHAFIERAVDRIGGGRGEAEVAPEECRSRPSAEFLPLGRIVRGG